MAASRFVLLAHDWPTPHWDFMLEAGGTLRTWRLAEIPAPGRTVAAEPLGEHRKLYLDYEGEVSGNRGQVKRFDGGTFTWETFQANRVIVLLEGDRLRGRAILERGTGDAWTCRLEPLNSPTG